MNKKDKNEPIKVEPGVYASPTTSSLKSIANKPIEAYHNKRPESTKADQKRKQAKAEMATSSFRAQPFISPISGRKKTNHVEVMIAHGIYDQITGKVLGTHEPVMLTEEAMVGATFTLTSDLSEILASGAQEESGQIPIQGRLVFSTLEGEFQIDANLVRVKLADSDTYAQYDRPLDDVLKERFGQLKGPQPLTRMVTADEDAHTVSEREKNLFLGSTDAQQPADNEQAAVREQAAVVTEGQVSKEETIWTALPLDDAFPNDVYYEIPTLDLLETGTPQRRDDDEWILEKMRLLEQAFDTLGVAATVTGDYVQGATVTQFEVALGSKTTIRELKALIDDLKPAVSATGLRVIPLLGTNTVGIEMANETKQLVRLKDVLSSPAFILHESPLVMGIGETVLKEAVYGDLLSVSHGLIVGQPGAGKSTCLHALLISLLYKAMPDTVNLLLLDSKDDFSLYADMPHLIKPVVTDDHEAGLALAWVASEIKRRHEQFLQHGVCDMTTFNKKRHDGVVTYEKMPYLVIVISELADVMKTSDDADAFVSLLQKACSAGVHILAATAEPTCHIMAPAFQAKMPMRLAFAVATHQASHVVLAHDGAEVLLGEGDLLMVEKGQDIRRIQGAFVSDEEVARVVAFVKSQGKPRYLVAEEDV